MKTLNDNELMEINGGIDDLPILLFPRENNYREMLLIVNAPLSRAGEIRHIDS